MGPRGTPSRTLLAEVDELILKIVARSPSGLTAAKVRGELPRSHRISRDLLQARFGALLQQGRLYAWAPPAARPRGSAALYWTVPFERWATDHIIQCLTVRPGSAAEVTRQAPRPLRALVRQRLDSLLADRRVFQHPPVKGRRVLSLEPADPVRLLSRELSTLCQKAERLGCSIDDLLEAVRRFATGRLDEGGAILAAMTALKPSAARGALVYIPDLRRRLRDRFPDKQAFDRAVLRLAETGRVQLQSHSLPSSLSREEQDAMIDNGRGSYYMAIGVRMG
jgi:hypothetical protein